MNTGIGFFYINIDYALLLRETAKEGELMELFHVVLESSSFEDETDSSETQILKSFRKTA